MTALTVYPASPNSTTFSSAELLVSASGAAQGSSENTTVNTSTGWGELGWGTPATFAAAGAIGSPSGKGAYYDGGSATLVASAISAGNWSATITLATSQASKTVSCGLTLRFYKYNTSTTTYTSIGSIAITSQTITSTASTFSFGATSLSSMSFSTNESLYIDLWINITSSTLTSGGAIQNYYSNGASTGFSGASVVTPGYGSVTNTWTANDVGLTPSDANAETLVQTQTDSTTNTETSTETIAESITDTALSCSDTLTSVSTGPTIAGTDTNTALDAISDTLASSLTDIALSSTDSIVAAVTVSYALSDVVLSTSDTISGTGSALNIAYNAGWTVLGNDTGNRGNSAGTWGTATDGQTWSIPTGSATLAISSNEMTATNCTSSTYIKIGSTTSADAEVIVRTAVNNTSTNGNGVFLRMTGTTTAYRCRFNASTSTLGFGLAKLVAGTSTNLTQVTLTVTTNSYYWLRFKIQGTSLYGKYWASGTAEPAAWTVTATDASITGAGGFGIYDSGSATSNIASYDNFYCIDNALDDNSVPPTDSLVESTIFVPTDTQTVVEVVSETDTFATITDIALSPIETASYTEIFVGAEQAIANLNLYVSGDIFSYSNLPVGIIQVDSLPCSDTYSFTQIFIPVETSASSEADSVTLSVSQQDALTPSEVPAPSLTYLVSDALSCSETGTFLEVVVTLDSVSFSDAFSESLVYVPTDSMSFSEIGADTLAFSWTDTAPNTSDTLLSSRPVAITDDTLNVSDSLVTVFTLNDAWQGTLSDTNTFQEIFVPFDAVTETEVSLYTEIFTKSDSALAITDNLLSGVPSNFQADSLTVTETLVVSGSVPALLFTDQLIAFDTLYVFDNLTDFSYVSDSYLTTVSSNTLEPRSNLYATIMSDNPTVYYQMSEGQFDGIFQRDGQDNVNNASNPTIIGALLSYTWAQLEPTEGVYNWSLIDNDILPWANQQKNIVLRVYTASTLADNTIAHFNMTATQATPSWVFTAGAPSVTGADSVVYPVYWNAVYQAKYAAFITQFALRYDTNPYVRGIVVGAGVDGSTSLERSGDTTANTLALWGPRGYSSATWAAAIHWAAAQYAMSFARTGILLSINSAFIVPDTVYNLTYCLDVAVQHAIWALDENASVNNLHTGQQWDIVTLATIAPGPTSITGSTLAIDLAVAINEQSDYTAVWAADVTAPSNQPTLTTYAAKVTQRYLHDVAPLQKNVTVSGAVYPSSRIITGDYLNGAQQFDGFTGYGMMTQSFQGDSSKWTMKASVYPTVLPTQEAIFVANGQTGVAAYGGYAMGIAAGSAGGAGQKFCAYIPGYGWYDSGYTFPATNTWYCCFIVYDGTYLTFYVNGVQTPLTAAITTYAMQPRATVGMIWDAVQLKELRYFTGYIDEIALYPTSLTSTRIQAISAAEMGLTDVNSSLTTYFTVQETPLTVSDSTSIITISQRITDSLTVSDIFAQSSINVAYLGEAILVNDLFNRSNQASWGVSTDGQIWTQPTANGTLSIVGNQGQITSMSGANVMLLGSNTAALVDGRIHVTMQSGTDATVGIILRAVSATQYYVARLNATNFGIVKVNGGSNTPLDDVAFAPSGGAGYWIRFRAVGSLLMAKYWIDTTSEPASYSSIGTDSTYTTGQMGLYASTTTGADIYTFSNFFAVDNYMTDFIPVGEVYNTTEILPPFVDVSNETEVTFIIESEVNLDVSVTEVEAVVYNAIMLGADTLSIAPSIQAWSVSYSPVEILTSSEALLSNSPTPLASDALVLTDVSTITNNPVPVDALTPLIDSIAEALIFAPIDILTVQEIGLDTEFDVPTVDLFYINEYPVYTNNNFLADAVATTDTLGFIEIFVPVDTVAPLDVSITTNIFLLIDSAPITSDGISNTVAYMTTDVATGDGSLNDFTSIFAIASAIIDTAPTVSDTILGANAQSIADVALTPSDLIVPTNNPSLTDTTLSSDTLILALVQKITDIAVSIEIVLSSSPANIPDVALTPSDSITPISIAVPIDTTGTADTFFSVTLSLLIDIATAFDSVNPTNGPTLVDLSATSDSLTDTISAAFTDLNTQLTTYLFTPIMQNTADPTVAASELPIALAINSNLIDTSTEQEVLITTNIFLLPDVALLPGIENIIESLFSVTTADSQTELESLLRTEIPQGLTDQIAPFDGFMAIVNPFIMDSLALTEINSVQIGVQFAESFSETEITLLALITSLIADQTIEIELLSTALQESDLTALTLLDVSTTTTNPTGLDSISVTTDIVAEGDIFVPVDPMTSLEKLNTTESYTMQDSVAITETDLAINITAPVDALLAQDLLIADTTVEILIDTPAIIDVSSVQCVFVPIDTAMNLDAISLAFIYIAQDTLAQVDASTTTITNKNTDSLALAASAQAWITGFVPRDVCTLLDVSTENLAQFELDVLSAQDVVPILGYGLLDSPLQITEAITYSKLNYVTVTTQLFSGNVQAIVPYSTVYATIFSGQIRGVLS